MKSSCIRSKYNRIIALVRKHKLNVKIPRLMMGGSYTMSALMLVFFYSHMGKVKTIADLKTFLVENGCHNLNPQPRHLGLQYGFLFLVQNGIHPRLDHPLRQGQYCLLHLRSAHPSALLGHRDKKTQLTSTQFAQLRAHYDDRCAVCGSKHGEPHYKNALLCTTIERGHADPRKPLTLQNCIPMCRLCNGAYKDKAVFNSRGLVVKWINSHANNNDS